MMRAPAADLFTPRPEPEVLTRYATDGKCHNAEPGTFNHECGKPATWLGTSRGRNGTLFISGYCNRCKADGYEARGVVTWKKIERKAS